MYNKATYNQPSAGFYQSPQMFYSSAPVMTERRASLDTLVAPLHYQSSKPMHEQKEGYTPSARASSFTYKNLQSYFTAPAKQEYHAVDGFLKLYRPKHSLLQLQKRLKVL